MIASSIDKLQQNTLGRGFALAGGALSGFLALAAPASGEVTNGPQSFVDAEILIGARMADGSRDAGLKLDIAGGWKTYWRSPGEAGVPPRFDWSKSTNLAAAEIAWPRPEVFDSFGYLTIGYANETVLPLRLVPKDPALPIGLRLSADLGVCRDICVFEALQIEADIMPGDPGTQATAIAAAVARVTPSAAEAGVTAVSCTLAGTGQDRAFSATVKFDAPPGDAHVALEGPDESWFHETVTTGEGNTIDVASTLSLPEGATWVERSDVRMTVLGEQVSADIRGCKAG